MEQIRKNIAFIRVFAGAPIAARVEMMLTEAFPEFEVVTITITDLLKARPDILFLNMLQTLKTYGTSALSGWRQFRRSFLATPYLFKQVKHLVASKLNAADYVFSFQLQSLFDASLPGLPHFVYTDHTHLANLEYEQFERSNIHSQEWIALERQVYQNAQMVFTRSSNITHSLIKQYGCPAEKVECVYVGVNVPISAKMDQPKDYTNKEILFVGLDWERKGGPELLQAFQQVMIAHPDAHLTIVGANLPVEVANCSVLGKLPIEAVQSNYEAASIFCLPTKLEPFGVVFVEAMSHRLPIVATDVGAIPDFVIDDENGYLIPPGNVPALAQALIKLLGDPRRCESFGNRSAGLVAQRYNWPKVAKLVRSHITGELQLSPQIMMSALDLAPADESR